MTDLARFDKDIDTAMREVVEPGVADMHRAVLRETFDAAIDLEFAAFLSGYYRANTRIELSATGDVDLEPPERPPDAEPLQFLDDVIANRFVQLGKLAGVQPFTATRIATAVPYAPELEQRDRTFQRAAEEGSARAAAKGR